jgi:hypothetical protein
MMNDDLDDDDDWILIKTKYVFDRYLLNMMTKDQLINSH